MVKNEALLGFVIAGALLLAVGCARPAAQPGAGSIVQYLLGPKSFRENPPNATLAFVSKGLESAVVVAPEG